MSVSAPVLCPDLLRTLLGPRNSHTNTTDNKPDPTTHDPDQTSPAQTNPKPTHYQSGSHHTTRIVRSHSPLTHDIWTIPDTECAKSGKGRLFPSSFLALPWLLIPSQSHPAPYLSSALPSFSAALLPTTLAAECVPGRGPAALPLLSVCSFVLRYSVRPLHSTPTPARPPRAPLTHSRLQAQLREGSSAVLRPLIHSLSHTLRSALTPPAQHTTCAQTLLCRPDPASPGVARLLRNHLGSHCELLICQDAQDARRIKQCKEAHADLGAIVVLR